MFPWLLFWSPQYHFPFSGSVAQRIDPDTRWFFAGIKPTAGNGELEEQIFDVASYGRQLGWITEVLLGRESDDAALQTQATRSLDKLRDVQARIEEVKSRNQVALLDAATAALAKLQQADPAAHAKLLASVSGPKRV